MEKSKHTPGPWTINHWSNDGGKGLCCIKQENGIQYFSGDAVIEKYFMVCADKKHLGTSQTFGDFQGPNIARIEIPCGDINETEANARLIARAPELLEQTESLKRDKELLMLRVEKVTNLWQECEREKEELEKAFKEELQRHIKTFEYELITASKKAREDKEELLKALREVKIQLEGAPISGKEEALNIINSAVNKLSNK